MEFNMEMLTAVDIDMYSDASRNFELGFGAYCGTEWTSGQWDKPFMEKFQPTIEYLQLYAVTVAVLNWIKLFRNNRICLRCDNEAVVCMINNTTAKCKQSMILLRLMVIQAMFHNVRINARHVRTKANGKPDALSRLDYSRFRRLGPNMNENPSSILTEIWPLAKIWAR